METYKEMKERHQAEVNALPLAFAFSERQYNEKLAEWNITPEEAKAADSRIRGVLLRARRLLARPPRTAPAGLPHREEKQSR